MLTTKARRTRRGKRRLALSAYLCVLCAFVAKCFRRRYESKPMMAFSIAHSAARTPRILAAGAGGSSRVGSAVSAVPRLPASSRTSSRR
jgi:hypothetical protein